MKRLVIISLAILTVGTYSVGACTESNITVEIEPVLSRPPAQTNIVAEPVTDSVSAGTNIPAAEWILARIDTNMTSTSSITVATMVIHGRRRPRTVKSKSWTKGRNSSFTEYLAPAREKGTKMLKLGDRMWVYSPHTDRTIQLSGHMLRQSVMGSDLSYEDLMDDPRLGDLYTATVTGTATVDVRVCWVLQLTARTNDVAYQSRKIWVDSERYVPVREELYAKGGKLLKRIELKDFKQSQNRWYPMRMVFKDMLKKGKGTEFIIESIDFNATIPKHLLTKAALRR